MNERLGWGESGGKQGSGDPNVLRLKDSQTVRLVDPEKVYWRQHVVENVEDSEQTEFVICPGPAKCPLCRKPADKKGNRYFPIQRKYATNVYDYATSSVKVLIAGPQVFDEFDDVAEVGINPMSSDWTIHKVGKGRNTKYKMSRHDAKAFEGEVTPDDLHDLAKYSTSKSEVQIFEILEKMGYDYDALEVPTFTLDEAEAFEMPYGKYKGMTIEQILAQDDQYVDWIYGQKKNDGALGDPVFLAFHKVLVSRGMVPELDDAGEPQAEEASSEQPEAEDKQPDQESEKTEKVTLKSPDGELTTVPPTAVAALIGAGFEVVDPDATMKEPADKGFTCDECDWEGKSKGALTQHKNREHADAGQPEAESEAAPEKGASESEASGESGGDHDQVLERVKTRLAGWQGKDYNALLDIFDEVAGKRNIVDFTTEELVKLEERLASE